MSNQLRPGDMFPHLSLNIPGADNIALPDDIGNDYAVVLFYRGHW